MLVSFLRDGRHLCSESLFEFLDVAVVLNDHSLELVTCQFEVLTCPIRPADDVGVEILNHATCLGSLIQWLSISTPTDEPFALDVHHCTEAIRASKVQSIV